MLDRSETTLHTDAKLYAKRLHTFCHQYLAFTDLKLGHCQEAIARHLFGFKSWNHLCACKSLRYSPPNLFQLGSFAYNLWLDNRFNPDGIPKVWFEPIDWFGKEIPAFCQTSHYHLLVNAAAYAFTEEDKELPLSVPFIDRWAEWSADQTNDYHHFDRPEWSPEERTRQIGKMYRIDARQKHFDLNKFDFLLGMMGIQLFTRNTLKDSDLTDLIERSINTAINQHWSLSACAYLGIFDQGKLLLKQLKKEGATKAKWAFKEMIMLGGQAPMMPTQELKPTSTGTLICCKQGRFNVYSSYTGRFEFEASLSEDELVSVLNEDAGDSFMNAEVAPGIDPARLITLAKINGHSSRIRTDSLEEVITGNQAGLDGSELAVEECIAKYLS